MSTERAQTSAETSSSDGVTTTARSRLRKDFVTFASSSPATTTSGSSLPHPASTSVAFRVEGSEKPEPSTRAAVDLLAKWGQELPLVVVTSDEENVVKSFRNLDRVVVTNPGKLQVAELVWARSVLVTQDALELVQAKAAKDEPKAKGETS